MNIRIFPPVLQLTVALMGLFRLTFALFAVLQHQRGGKGCGKPGPEQSNLDSGITRLVLHLGSVGKAQEWLAKWIIAYMYLGHKAI